ncbi:MAG: glycosyltransferase [Opitutales bacterium]
MAISPGEEHAPVGLTSEGRPTTRRASDGSGSEPFEQPKVAILYATFPQPTETFVRRELRAMLDMGAPIVPFSIWQGGGEFHGVEVRPFRLRELFSLVWWLPLWLARRPHSFVEVLSELWGRGISSWQNWQETFLGFGFGLVRAEAFRREGFTRCHAVWSTMPATSALVIRKLVGIQFSVGSHAYDVFRDGGDCLLRMKLSDATFVRTSSEATRKRLLELGAPPAKTILIRRGLSVFPPLRESSLGGTLNILSVGRLVPKKGYSMQLNIYRALVDAGVAFRAIIVGGGPLWRELERERERLGLREKVTFLGALPRPEVALLQEKADLFFFTGISDDSGDRDGLPNVLPEAMAAGAIVLTSPTGGATEAVVDGKSGFVLCPQEADAWVDRVEKLLEERKTVDRVRREAREWTKNEFDVSVTARRLLAALGVQFGEAGMLSKHSRKRLA